MNKSLKKWQLAKELAGLTGDQNAVWKKYERDFTKQDLLALLEWADDNSATGSDLKTKINEKKSERKSARNSNKEAKTKAKSSSLPKPKPKPEPKSKAEPEPEECVESKVAEIIIALFFLLIIASMIKSCFFSDRYTLEDYHNEHPLQKQQYDRNKMIRDAYER